MFLFTKILAVITALTGMIAFVDPLGGWYILPITISIGCLIFSLACFFEKLIKAINEKTNNIKCNK